MHFAFQGNWKFKLCAAIGLSLWALMGVAQTAPQVLFKTSLGEFTVEVYPNKAPKTVDNFLRYVKDKHYDGTVFHRVMDGFMVQGGGFTADMKQKPTRAPVALEAMNGLKNEVGTIAMARSSDLNSATSQFFFNLADNTALDSANGGYAVFGKVIGGSSVLDALAITPTSTLYGLNDFPSQSVIVQSVTQTQ